MRHLLSLVAIIMALLVPQLMNARTGVNYTPGASFFSVETNGNAQQVKLRIYKDGLGGKPVKTIDMKRDKSGSTLWQASVKGDLKGKFYTFDVKYNGKFRGECPGIWATAVGVNGKRGAIVDMEKTNPQGWDADKRPAIAAKDLILYEMHHRDFSIDESGDFTYKGKFLALTEPRAINHLKALGVNAVHILPSFDYASVDETRLDQPQYNWGYDPVNYNVPEGGYSTDPYKPEVRISEFKQMVQALHKAGIKVILDVVYNHTWNIDGSNFQLTRPDYFYRKNADGTYSNGSGCGNETASEREGMRQFMVESVKYWVDEYHIDGFRFDLMGVHDIETMNAIRNAVPQDIYIYGEGWSAGSCAYSGDLAMKANTSKMPGIAAFSDEIRDALRGPWDTNSKAAFLGGVKGNEESIKFGIVGAIQHPGVDYSQVNYSKAPYANEPTQMMPRRHVPGGPTQGQRQGHHHRRTHPPGPDGTDRGDDLARRAVPAQRRGDAARQEGCAQQLREPRQHQPSGLGQPGALPSGDGLLQGADCPAQGPSRLPHGQCRDGAPQPRLPAHAELPRSLSHQRP